MTNYTAESVAALQISIESASRAVEVAETVLSVRKDELRVLRGEMNKASEAVRAENTDRARWMRATKALRKDGVKFLANVQKCCRGCIDAATLGLEDGDETTPYGYTYGGQGRRISWDARTGKATEKQDRWSNRSPVVAMINHGNSSAEKIVAAFKAEGFEVTWDGQDYQCVEVKF